MIFHNGAGGGGLDKKNRPELAACVSAASEERKGGYGVADPGFSYPVPRQAPRTF